MVIMLMTVWRWHENLQLFSVFRSFEQPQQEISPPGADFEREVDDRSDPGILRLVAFLDECIDLFVLEPNIAFVVDDRPFHILGVYRIYQKTEFSLAVIDDALEDGQFAFDGASLDFFRRFWGAFGSAALARGVPSFRNRPGFAFSGLYWPRPPGLPRVTNSASRRSR